jgi:hypothetical protein
MALAAALIAWGVTSPYLTGAAIARSGAAKRLIARYYVPSIVAGWLGLSLLAVGVLWLDGEAALFATLAGAPMAGLAFWVRRDSGDDGEGPANAPPDEPPPGGDEVEPCRAPVRTRVCEGEARRRSPVRGGRHRSPVAR